MEEWEGKEEGLNEMNKMRGDGIRMRKKRNTTAKKNNWKKMKTGKV